MADILKFNGQTVGSISVESVLQGAASLDEILVLGWTKDGEFYAASSTGNGPDLLWLIELFRHGVLAEGLDG
jgi:hypothetical protein